MLSKSSGCQRNGGTHLNDNIRAKCKSPPKQTAKPGEDWRASDQARPVLLAAVSRELVSREPPDAAAVWRYAAADGRVTPADGVGMARKAKWLKSRGRRRGVGEIASERSDW